MFTRKLNFVYVRRDNGVNGKGHFFVRLCLQLQVQIRCRLVAGMEMAPQIQADVTITVHVQGPRCPLYDSTFCSAML